MDIEKSCGAVVYRKTVTGIEVLAVKSRTNGDWGLPKGHVEDGESEEETARREVFEETGLEITLKKGFRTTVEYTMPNGIAKKVVYFIGEATGQDVTIQQEEIQEYRWLKYNDMLSLMTYENIREVLMKANSFLVKLVK